VKRIPAGLLLCAFGLSITGLVELSQPSGGPSLYDGVVVDEPYRYVAPASGQVGSPSSAQVTLSPGGGTSPAIVIATIEIPPQAQLLAASGVIALRDGTTSARATINPVAASAAQAAAAAVYGNVYRFSVVDQNGQPLDVAAGASPTIVLRAPLGSPSVGIAHWDGQAWQPLATSPGASAGIFTARADALGDFALVAAPNGVPMWLLVGVAVLAVGVIGSGLLLLRRPRAAAASCTKRRRSASTRRGGRP
jgi:hypothetical protein